MNWFVDVPGGYGGVFFLVLSLSAITFLHYTYAKRRFRKWQFSTVGINSKARYKALKDSESIKSL